MPLNDGYGVLIGTINNYFRDDPDDFGRYYHGNLDVNAPNGVYRCAIDVDSKQSNTGVEWRTVPISRNDLNNLLLLGQGFHNLPSTPNSGAIDYIRSPMLIHSLTIGCNPLFRLINSILPLRITIKFSWKRGTSIQALQDLEPLVQTTQNSGLLTLVFGEPFNRGLGVHNIHQNQGDPIGSRWANENGIWQDGCTIFQQTPDLFVAFLNKFTTQSYTTDNNGHPI